MYSQVATFGVMAVYSAGKMSAAEKWSAPRFQRPE